MNWVTSGLPLDTHVNSPNDIDSRRVSAGMKNDFLIVVKLDICLKPAARLTR